MTRTIVFRVPDRELEVLVTLGLDGGPTLAFRPGYGSWGPPIQAHIDEQHHTPPTLSDESAPGEPETATVYDATIRVCPFCGGDLARLWESSWKRCKGCGANIRNGLVTAEEAARYE